MKTLPGFFRTLPVLVSLLASTLIANAGAEKTGMLLANFSPEQALRTERRASSVRLGEWPGASAKVAIVTIKDIPSGKPNDNTMRLFQKIGDDWSAQSGDTLTLRIGWKFNEKPRGRHRLFLLIQSNAGTANITLSPKLDGTLPNDGTLQEFTAQKSAAGNINWQRIAQIAVIIDGLTPDDSGEIAVAELTIR